MKLDALSQGRRWLEQAEADQQGAQLLLDGGSYHLACFVAQQVAEKALKAFLYAQGEDAGGGVSLDKGAREQGSTRAEGDRGRGRGVTVTLSPSLLVSLSSSGHPQALVLYLRWGSRHEAGRHR